MKDGISNIRYILIDKTHPTYSSLITRFRKVQTDKQAKNTLTIRECINPKHSLVKVCGGVDWLEREEATLQEKSLTSDIISAKRVRSKTDAIIEIYKYADIPIVKGLLAPSLSKGE